MIENRLIALKGDQILSKISEIVDDYSQVIVPIDDQRSTANYRKQVCLNILKDFLETQLSEINIESITIEALPGGDLKTGLD